MRNKYQMKSDIMWDEIMYLYHHARTHSEDRKRIRLHRKWNAITNPLKRKGHKHKNPK